MTGVEFAIVCGFVFLAALVQGASGIGFGLVAGPALVAIDPGFVPGPLLLGGVLIGARHVIAEWDQLERQGLIRSFIGLPVGVIIALLALRAATADQMAVGIGVAVCVMTAALLGGLAPARTPITEVLGGAAAALTSTAAGLPGPPLVIAYHDLNGAALRSTASAFVNVLAVVAVGSLAVVGEFGRHELWLLVLMLPSVAVGLFVSRWVRPWLDRDWFRPAVLVLSFLGGLVLIVDRLL